MAAVERLPVHHGRLYFISFGIIGPIVGLFENGFLLMYTLEGVSSVADFITTYEESQIKPRLPFSNP